MQGIQMLATCDIHIHACVYMRDVYIQLLHLEPLVCVMHTHMYMCIYTYMYICIYTYTYHMHIFTNASINTYVHVYIHTYAHINMWSCIQIHAYIDTHKYMHTQTHIYTLAYTYTPTGIFSGWGRPQPSLISHALHKVTLHARTKLRRSSFWMARTRAT